MSGAPELGSGTTWHRTAPVFESPEDVKIWTTATSRRLEDIAIDVTMSAVMLKALLEKVPDGKLGFSSRFRARLVARCLHSASKQLNAAAGHTAATYLVFLRQFSDELGG